MIKSERLEWALLRAIANASADDWAQLSLGELRNRLNDVDASVATEKIHIIVDAFISLGGEQALLMRKHEGGGRPQPFDFQKQNDEGYTSNFFSRDHFEVKLTHEGRRRITEPAAGSEPVSADPSRHAKGYDQRLADEILRTLNERFPAAITVDQLRTDLTGFSAIDQPKWFLTIDALVRDGLVECKIILTTAATLHAHGQTDITTARQAAEALRPLAGNGAYLLFTLGLIGTGMLGVPVLVGSCAYAVAEGAVWRGSMADKPRGAPKFYAVMAVAMAVGLVLNYLGFNAVKMLFWSAVINGLLAPPLILLVVLLTSNQKVMGKRVNPPLLKYLGWATFAVMTAAAVGMIITS
jgi:hypothetical protein